MASQSDYQAMTSHMMFLIDDNSVRLLIMKTIYCTLVYYRAVVLMFNPVSEKLHFCISNLQQQIHLNRNPMLLGLRVLSIRKGY